MFLAIIFVVILSHTHTPFWISLCSFLLIPVCLSPVLWFSPFYPPNLCCLPPPQLAFSLPFSLPVLFCSHCIHQILESVTYIHHYAIVHRDLKVSIIYMPFTLSEMWGGKYRRCHNRQNLARLDVLLCQLPFIFGLWGGQCPEMVSSQSEVAWQSPFSLPISQARLVRVGRQAENPEWNLPCVTQAHRVPEHLGQIITLFHIRKQEWKQLAWFYWPGSFHLSNSFPLGLVHARALAFLSPFFPPLLSLLMSASLILFTKTFLPWLLPPFSVWALHGCRLFLLDHSICLLPSMSKVIQWCMEINTAMEGQWAVLGAFSAESSPSGGTVSCSAYVWNSAHELEKTLSKPIILDGRRDQGAPNDSIWECGWLDLGACIMSWLWSWNLPHCG